jgi:hypothetical protein
LARPRTNVHNARLMSSPKPGQILCPTCHRATPPAAYCTQCGAAISGSARPRPRGMDRDELEERLRLRRPGDPAFRRGGPHTEPPEAAYEPFAPEPEDQLAVRPETPAPAATPHIDDTPEGFDEAAAAATSTAWPRQEWRADAPEHEPPSVPAQPYYEEPYRGEPYEPAYDTEDEAYAHVPVPPGDNRPRGSSTALPIVGFAALSVLAVGVGVALSGILTGGATGRASPTPLASVAPSVEPTSKATAGPTGSSGASTTPEPNDGPVAFPDGAVLAIQPCDTSGFRNEAVGQPEEDACETDGSTVSGGEAWAFIVFQNASGSDELSVLLRSEGDTVNDQEIVLSSVLGDCGTSCDGLVYGAHYVDLPAGDYELVLRRNGDFADSATFTVES